MQYSFKKNKNMDLLEKIEVWTWKIVIFDLNGSIGKKVIFILVSSYFT